MKLRANTWLAATALSGAKIGGLSKRVVMILEFMHNKDFGAQRGLFALNSTKIWFWTFQNSPSCHHSWEKLNCQV